MSGLRTLPVEVLMEGRLAVCLGACAEVAAKLPRLLAAGARVVVIADGEIDPAIALEATQGTIVLERRTPTRADADGAIVTFVSPEHEPLGAELAASARPEGRLVCTLDRPHACTFVNPAMARGSHLTITLSSGGRAPALLRRLRVDLERALASPRLAAYVERLAALRAAAPPGERSALGRAGAKGFAAELSLRFPRWFEEGRSEPPAEGERDETERP